MRFIMQYLYTMILFQKVTHCSKKNFSRDNLLSIRDGIRALPDINDSLGCKSLPVLMDISSSSEDSEDNNSSQEINPIKLNKDEKNYENKNSLLYNPKNVFDIHDSSLKTEISNSQNFLESIINNLDLRKSNTNKIEGTIDFSRKLDDSNLIGNKTKTEVTTESGKDNNFEINENFDQDNFKEIFASSIALDSDKNTKYSEFKIRKELKSPIVSEDYEDVEFDFDAIEKNDTEFTIPPLIITEIKKVDDPNNELLEFNQPNQNDDSLYEDTQIKNSHHKKIKELIELGICELSNTDFENSETPNSISIAINEKNMPKYEIKNQENENDPFGSSNDAFLSILHTNKESIDSLNTDQNLKPVNSSINESNNLKILPFDSSNEKNSNANSLDLFDHLEIKTDANKMNHFFLECMLCSKKLYIEIEPIKMQMLLSNPKNCTESKEIIRDIVSKLGITIYDQNKFICFDCNNSKKNFTVNFVKVENEAQPTSSLSNSGIDLDRSNEYNVILRRKNPNADKNHLKTRQSLSEESGIYLSSDDRGSSLQLDNSFNNLEIHHCTDLMSKTDFSNKIGNPRKYQIKGLDEKIDIKKGNFTSSDCSKFDKRIKSDEKGKIDLSINGLTHSARRSNSKKNYMSGLDSAFEKELKRTRKNSYYIDSDDVFENDEIRNSSDSSINSSCEDLEKSSSEIKDSSSSIYSEDSYRCESKSKKNARHSFPIPKKLQESNQMTKSKSFCNDLEFKPCKSSEKKNSKKPNSRSLERVDHFGGYVSNNTCENIMVFSPQEKLKRSDRKQKNGSYLGIGTNCKDLAKHKRKSKNSHQRCNSYNGVKEKPESIFNLTTNLNLTYPFDDRRYYKEHIKPILSPLDRNVCNKMRNCQDFTCYCQCNMAPLNYNGQNSFYNPNYLPDNSGYLCERTNGCFDQRKYYDHLSNGNILMTENNKSFNICHCCNRQESNLNNQYMSNTIITPAMSGNLKHNDPVNSEELHNIPKLHLENPITDKKDAVCENKIVLNPKSEVQESTNSILNLSDFIIKSTEIPKNTIDLEKVKSNSVIEENKNQINQFSEPNLIQKSDNFKDNSISYENNIDNVGSNFVKEVKSINKDDQKLSSDFSISKLNNNKYDSNNIETESPDTKNNIEQNNSVKKPIVFYIDLNERKNDLKDYKLLKENKIKILEERKICDSQNEKIKAVRYKKFKLKKRSKKKNQLIRVANQTSKDGANKNKLNDFYFHGNKMQKNIRPFLHEHNMENFEVFNTIKKYYESKMDKGFKINLKGVYDYNIYILYKILKQDPFISKKYPEDFIDYSSFIIKFQILWNNQQNKLKIVYFLLYFLFK